MSLIPLSSDFPGLRRSLSRLGFLLEDTDKPFPDADLDRSIRLFQRNEGLREDGVVRSGGETERALKRALRGERNAFGPKEPHIRLFGKVGQSLENLSEDVKQVQRGLGTLGLIPRSRGFEPTGIIDAFTDNGIREFQKRNSLKIDGKLFPDGETERAMNRVLKRATEETGKPPVPQKKPEPPKTERGENQSSGCEGKEITWTNASAKLFMIKQRYDQKQAKKRDLEQKIQEIDSQIAKIESDVKQHADGITGTTTIIGAGVGGAAGGIATKTAVGAIEGARKGGEAGSSIGEGIVNALKAQTILLKRQKTSVMKEIEILDKEIAKIVEEGNKAESDVAQKRQVYQECIKSQKQE